MGMPIVTEPWTERNRHKQGLIWQRLDESRYHPDPEMALHVIFVERCP